MGDYYSSMTGMHYSSKEMMESMEKKYLADIEKKKLEKIKESNELAKMQLEKERENTERIAREARENAEKIAEATRQAEKERYNNQLAIEQMRQEHDKKMRFYKLCDDFGINYDEIYYFNISLNFVKNEIKEKYSNAIEKVKELIETNEVKSIYKRQEDLVSKLAQTKDDLTKIQNITVKGVKNNGIDVSGSEEKINKFILENKTNIPIVKNFSVWIMIITLILFFLTINSIGISILIIGGILDLIFWDRFLRLKKRT